MAGRGVRFEYEVGEIILCFEPDPTKARVLYEAKVIEQRASKDVSGKKQPAYVVHFQGWNSSWDREVFDSFLLRDTTDNRDLMRRLADTARKYCRKNSQRRRKINTILHTAFGGAPPDFGALTDTDDSGDDEGEGKKYSKGKASQDKKKQKTNIGDYEIPDSLKAQLEDDYWSINKKEMLTAVPASPCVVDVLESFMKHFCVNFLCDPVGQREKTRTHSSRHTLKCPPDKCISLCKEFVDSIRVIFDFSLPMILLYRPEQGQYEDALRDVKPGDMHSVSKDEAAPQGLEDPPVCSKRDRLKKQEVSSSSSSEEEEQEEEEDVEASPPRRLTRQAVSMESLHADSIPSSFQAPGPSNTRFLRQSDTRSPRPPISEARTPNSPSHRRKPREPPTEGLSITGSSPHTREPIIPIASRTRNRSQSHLEIGDSSSCQVSAQCGPAHMVKQEMDSYSSDSEIELCLPPLLPGQEEDDKKPSDRTEGVCSAQGTESLTLGSSRGREDAMDRILGWSLLPPEVRGRGVTVPSLVYGPVHLLRLFVKLPDLLKKMKMKEVQQVIINKFIYHCLQYLVDHQSELIHEDTYIRA